MAVLQRKQAELGGENSGLRQNLNEKTQQTRDKCKMCEDPHYVNNQEVNSQQNAHSRDYHLQPYEGRHRPEQRRNDCANSAHTPPAAHQNQRVEPVFHSFTQTITVANSLAVMTASKATNIMSKITMAEIRLAWRYPMQGLPRFLDKGGRVKSISS